MTNWKVVYSSVCKVQTINCNTNRSLAPMIEWTGSRAWHKQYIICCDPCSLFCVCVGDGKSNPCKFRNGSTCIVSVCRSIFQGFPQNLFEAKCWYCQSLCMRKNRTNKMVDFEFLSIHAYFKRLFNMIQILQICNLNKYRIRSCDLFIKCGVLSAGFHNISHGYGKSKVQWSRVKCKIGHGNMFLPWLAMMCKRLNDSMKLRGPENKWPPLQKFHVLFNSIPFGPKSGRPIQKPTWLQTATSWM